MVNSDTLTGYQDLPLPRSLPRVGEPEFATFDYRGNEVRAVGPATDTTDVIVTVAQTRSGFEAISRRITATAIGVGLGFFLLATALSLWAANTALTPIDRITGSVTRRSPKELRPVTAEIPTELVPLVDALNSFMARLRASLSQTENFIAKAAHRVRTPLATVRAQAEVTYRKLNKPEHKSALREMIQAIDESSRSAGQMLDHAMVTFRADSLALDDLDLNTIMTDIRDIIIRRDWNDTPLPFKGEGILIQAALQNILDNAIKYSPDDSKIVVRVTIDKALHLSITDQGRGFGDMDRPHLTIRFVRGSNVDGIVGSGLGLPIADEAARTHGGHLEITDNPKGAGACVSLVLPLS